MRLDILVCVLWQPKIITKCNQSHDSVSSTLKDTVTRLSKASGVMSEYTSYVAVDESNQVPVQGHLIYHDMDDSVQYYSVQAANCSLMCAAFCSASPSRSLGSSASTAHNLRRGRPKGITLRMPKLKMPRLGLFRRRSVEKRSLSISNSASASVGPRPIHLVVQRSMT